MTPKEFENRMLFLEQEYGRGEDEETFHHEADDLMMKVLIQLGYENGVEIFDRNPKWYSVKGVNHCGVSQWIFLLEWGCHQRDHGACILVWVYLHGLIFNGRTSILEGEREVWN